jgi:hypothetical protein
VVELSAAGTEIGQTTLPAGDGLFAAALRARADGNLLLVANRETWSDGKLSASAPRLLLLTAKAAVTWETALAPPAPGSLTAGRAVLGLGEGTAIVAGRVSEAGVLRASLWRVDPEGKLVWQKGYGSPVAGELAALALQGSAIIAAGWQSPQGKPDRGWLLGLDQSGEALWHRLLPEAVLAVRGLAVFPGGRLLLAGQRAPMAGILRAWSGGTDTLGHLAWQRDWEGSDEALGLAAAVFPDGAGGLAGRGLVGAAEQALFARRDPWGHASCAAAGLCVGVEAKGCEDGNACTIDLCQPQKGCEKIAADGQSCDATDGCTQSAVCSASACQMGKEGLYFGKVYQGKDTGLHSLVAVEPAPDGGFALLGQAEGTGLPVAVRTDTSGQIVGKVVTEIPASPGYKWSQTVDGRLLPDGGWVLLGYALTGKYLSSSSVDALRTDAGGQKLWQYQACDSSSGGTTAWQCSASRVLWQPGNSQALLPANYFMIPNYGTPQGEIRAYSLRLSDGNLLWKGAYSHLLAPGVNLLPRSAGGVRIGASESLLVGGYTQSDNYNANPYVGWYALRLSQSGAALWLRTYNPGMWTLAAALLDDNTFVVVGYGWDAKGQYWPALAAIDGDGNLLWQKNAPATSYHYAYDVLPLGGTDFAVAGGRVEGGKYRVWLARMGSGGHLVWERSHGPVGAGKTYAAWCRPLALLPDGGFALAASHEGFAGWDTALWRLDAWGHADCPSSGACIGKKPEQCSDGNPCTADLCEPVKGCTFAPLDGAPCGGGKVCKGAICGG